MQTFILQIWGKMSLLLQRIDNETAFLNHFQLGKELGSGAFASVYEVKDKKAQSVVAAVKIVKFGRNLPDEKAVEEVGW